MKCIINNQVVSVVTAGRPARGTNRFVCKVGE